jgi:hypothetical protein
MSWSVGQVATLSGLGVAAALVGAFGSLTLLLEFNVSTVGAGVFRAGFLLFITVWEYVRRGMFRDTVSVTTIVD